MNLERFWVSIERMKIGWVETKPSITESSRVVSQVWNTRHVLKWRKSAVMKMAICGLQEKKGRTFKMNLLEVLFVEANHMIYTWSRGTCAKR